MGYEYVALGGMVPLKTAEIVACLETIATIRDSKTRLHLLGVTRVAQIATFEANGVASFDSTSPLRQAFKDDSITYWKLDGAYTAIRVPQVEGNRQLRLDIRSGKISQTEAIKLERRCLEALRAYDSELESLDGVLDALRAYGELCGVTRGRNRTDEYRTTLEA